MLYDNLAVNEQGHLTVGGLDTVALAKEFGAPLYVLDEDKLRENCRIYVQALRENMPEGSYPLFAGKALCFKGLYPVLNEEGMGADVVSPGEIYTALAGGFPAEKLYFHGNNKTDEDIAYALDSHVGCFIVDNHQELARLDEAAGVRGIWNFTNYEINFDPQAVVVESVHFSDSLLALNYMISQREAEERRETGEEQV